MDAYLDVRLTVTRLKELEHYEATALIVRAYGYS